jgi:hypothetical protein
MSSESESLPVACTLASESMAERRRVWRALADHALIEQLKTEDGVSLIYSARPGVEDTLRELVALEADCCAFARWQVEPRGPRLILEVTAPDDAVASLQAMFA